MLDKIRFGAGVADRRGDDPAGRDLDVGDQCLGAVAKVFELLSFRLAGLHGTGGMKPFQRLDAGFLVGADDMNAPLMEFRRLVIELAHGSDVHAEAAFVFYLVIQSVPGPMRFKVPLILKSARCWFRKSAPQCPGERLPAPVPGASYD